MGDAYTPGLTVTGEAMVRKTRRLPISGTVLVDVGRAVGADDIVARTELPGRVHLVNFANALGVLPEEIHESLTIQPGSDVKTGMELAMHRSFFGLLKSRVESPIDGVFESVSKVTGQAVLREPPIPVEIAAYIQGAVVEELPGEGVVVESRAALVQGIFGLAGEVHAPLEVVCQARDQKLTKDLIRNEHAGKILIGGARVTLDAMRHALEIGVKGIVSGGFAYHDVKELLGYDVGVAITGTEDLPTTLVVTEGFGDIAMARATYELLCGHAGKDASITGATQIRAGVIRPEVVIPLEQHESGHDRTIAQTGLEIGVEVRCIRAPYFGRIGTISALPVELQVMPSETKVRVLDVTLETGETITVPRANVEVIEQ